MRAVSSTPAMMRRVAASLRTVKVDQCARLTRPFIPFRAFGGSTGSVNPATHTVSAITESEVLQQAATPQSEYESATLRVRLHGSAHTMEILVPRDMPHLFSHTAKQRIGAACEALSLSATKDIDCFTCDDGTVLPESNDSLLYLANTNQTLNVWFKAWGPYVGKTEQVCAYARIVHGEAPPVPPVNDPLAAASDFQLLLSSIQQLQSAVEWLDTEQTVPSLDSAMAFVKDITSLLCRLPASHTLRAFGRPAYWESPDRANALREMCSSAIAVLARDVPLKEDIDSAATQQCWVTGPVGAGKTHISVAFVIAMALLSPRIVPFIELCEQQHVNATPAAAALRALTHRLARPIPYSDWPFAPEFLASVPGAKKGLPPVILGVYDGVDRIFNQQPEQVELIIRQLNQFANNSSSVHSMLVVTCNSPITSALLHSEEALPSWREAISTTDLSPKARQLLLAGWPSSLGHSVLTKKAFDKCYPTTLPTLSSAWKQIPFFPMSRSEDVSKFLRVVSQPITPLIRNAPTVRSAKHDSFLAASERQLGEWQLNSGGIPYFLMYASVTGSPATAQRMDPTNPVISSLLGSSRSAHRLVMSYFVKQYDDLGLSADGLLSKNAGSAAILHSSTVWQPPSLTPFDAYQLLCASPSHNDIDLIAADRVLIELEEMEWVTRHLEKDVVPAPPASGRLLADTTRFRLLFPNLLPRVRAALMSASPASAKPTADASEAFTPAATESPSV